MRNDSNIKNDNKVNVEPQNLLLPRVDHRNIYAIVIVVTIALLILAYSLMQFRKITPADSPVSVTPFPSVGEYSPDSPTSIPDISQKPQINGRGGAVYCTAEVLECPDGSYVGRQPPTCEFAKCK